MAIRNDSIGIALFVFAILAAISNIVSIVLKSCKDFTNPKLWKYSLLYQDVAYTCLSIGLLLFFVDLYNDVPVVCDAAGFFLLFGIIQCLLSYLTTGIILLSIQNPGKSSSISSFHRNVYIVIVTPQVIIGFVLSVLPYLSDGLFDTDIEFDILCFPIRDHGKQGAAFGTLLVVIWWLIIIAFVVCDVIIVLKLWKFHNRINSAQNNVWQAQLIAQGKILVIISVFEHVICAFSTLTTTLTLYVDVAIFKNNNTWIVMTSLALSVIVHGVVSNICNVMWTSCCCRDSSSVKEPHRKLKKLELLSIETSGKLRMKATWTIGKHATKRGLMKVYGSNHLKSWAQEIVMLGMLRRIQHPSLIQCLWTNSSNPYYETMTLISGEIITSDSRIICLELTNGGTLRDFLQKVELPLPEQCQRMIVHDIAEGLFYLHHENIVHSNLNSSCIYLKGSLQSMVLRAAVGDFEDAQLYGTLQQSLDSSIKDKRYFFLPDIRSFAIVALEVVTTMCEKKFQNRYVNYNSEHVPLKLNLTNVISDEDDEFEAQYSYEAEDTHRMFHAIHHDEDDDDSFDSESEEIFHMGKKSSGSLANLKSPRRPMSPAYDGRDVKTPDTIFNSSQSEDESPRAESSVYPTTKPDTSQLTYNTAHTGKTEESLRKNHQKSNINTKNQMKHKSLGGGTDIIPPQGNSVWQTENGRCVSPDPMKDEKLQELRKETKSSAKLSKKERKFSFSKKKHDEDFPQKNKMEAFVKSSDEQNMKRKDGNWLNKPTSLLKSITSNDTTVSVFKAKATDEENHLDAIEEEDISPTQRSVPRQVKVKEAKDKKAEVWDIIDEQYYTQVNKKALNKLKKTVSGESRSSLWSFISTPEDLDDDDMDNILDCLPGMADPMEFRKPEITVSDIMAERENAQKKDSVRKKFNFTDMSKSKFELIDYYEMLKSKQITINDVPEDKREMLLNVVELRREEKRRKNDSTGNVIRSDEMYDNNMSPGSSNNNMKVKMVSFRNTQCHSSPQRNPFPEQRDPRLDRARSAPLKRPRTPMHKPSAEKTPEINPAFNDNKSVTIAKRNRARAALKRALNNKGKLQNSGLDRGRQSGLAVKYATVRKVATSANEAENEQDTGEVITVPVPTSESFSITNAKPHLSSVKRYPSFSSNESGSTLVSSERHRGGPDSSLTSGEVSSLSSQAESDHYETDYHMTDTEMGNKHSPNGRKVPQTPSSRVDSGFDSGSMSSEMSDAFTNRKLQLNTQFQVGSNKGIVDSWARNFKVSDSKSECTTYFANNCLPPVDCLPQKTVNCEHDTIKSDKTLSENMLVSSKTKESDTLLTNSHAKVRNVRHRKRAMPHRQRESLNITPYTSVSSRSDEHFSRSLSPQGRVLSPVGRPATPSRSLSPSSTRQVSQSRFEKSFMPGQMSKPTSPTVSQSLSDPRGKTPDPRPMSPLSRPMSPNVHPTNNRAIKSNPMSSISRTFSPTNIHSNVTDPRPFSPGRKLNRPSSPQDSSSVNNTLSTNSDSSQNSDTVSVAESSTSKASKRYRELIKKGVPLRTSVIDANPPAPDIERISEVQTRPATAESLYEDHPNDQELFENLDANGFFEPKQRSRSPSPTKTFNNVRGRSPINTKNHEKNADTKQRKKKRIPLDQIVRESPDTRGRQAHRSPSKNHLAITDEAILNQPTSEDSETCSIKTNKSNTSTPSGSKPKLMIDAELVIDRIFSQNQPEDNELDVEVEAALGLDKDPFKAVKEMYLKHDQSDTPNLNEIPLLNGVNQKHIHECIEMASSLHVLTLRDLLPASQESFEVLRNKLQQVGQLGTVGHQLLDVIHKCWLQDMPPSSGDLVEQLTDPVTETEL